MLVDPKKYKKLPDEALQEKLSPIAYGVTQRALTELPFSGEYCQHKKEGIFVDIATGEPLFSSSDKFDGTCGWPCFAKPIDPAVITKHADHSRGMIRTEVKSRVGKSHLGHVFDDGPAELGGMRYCINSVALHFIPYEKMDEEGYGDFKECVKKSE